MLETVRAYAALELTAAGERDDALEGLARYCAGEASLAAEGLVGPAQVEWLDRVRDDLESYRGALTWLIERGRSDRSVRHRVGADVLLGDPRPCGRRPPVVRTDSEPAVASAGCRVESARRRGSDVVHAGRPRRARAPGSTRALALAHDAGDTDAVAHAEYLLGHVEHAVGNLDAARDRFTRSVEGFRALAIPWGTGQCADRAGVGRPCDRRCRPGRTPAR